MTQEVEPVVKSLIPLDVLMRREEEQKARFDRLLGEMRARQLVSQMRRRQK